MYPLSEMLLVLTCATIASCDDFDDIVTCGKHHLYDLRRFAPFHHRIPCVPWMRALVNRVDPTLFGACFDSWIVAPWPGRHDLIAIDGKTSRRTHDGRTGLKALHTLSAYASNARLVPGQLSVPEKANKITAVPALLDHLAEAGHLEGALVTIDAMGTQVAIAAKIVSHGADYLLPLKGNQPTLEADVADYVRTAPTAGLVTRTTVEKGHGRIEAIKSILKIATRTEHADRSTLETRHFISSSAPDIERIAQGVRGHWGEASQGTPPAKRDGVAGGGVESMRWLLDVAFKDDLSRTRTGHGAKNMAVIHRFALNLVRANPQKGSVKTKRNTAGWSSAFRREILGFK